MKNMEHFTPAINALFRGSALMIWVWYNCRWEWRGLEYKLWSDLNKCAGITFQHFIFRPLEIVETGQLQLWSFLSNVSLSVENLEKNFITECIFTTCDCRFCCTRLQFENFFHNFGKLVPNKNSKTIALNGFHLVFVLNFRKWVHLESRLRLFFATLDIINCVYLVLCLKLKRFAIFKIESWASEKTCEWFCGLIRRKTVPSAWFAMWQWLAWQKCLPICFLWSYCSELL